MADGQEIQRALLSSLRTKSAEQLKNKLTLKGTSDLRDMAAKLGAFDVLANPLLKHDSGAFRAALMAWILEGADDSDGEAAGSDDELDPSVIAHWLEAAADPWPAASSGELLPPKSEEAREVGERWSAAARGYEVRLCQDAPHKGRGLFATRDQRSGSVVGIYWGEELTHRGFALRHGWKHGMRCTPTPTELAGLEERRERLRRLTAEEGAPMPNGADNGGAYAILLLPDMPDGAKGLPGLAAWIDAEDPHLSSWCRFANHAEEASEGCNCEVRVDGARRLVWIETARDIACGEEICFHYGSENVLSVNARRRKKLERQARHHPEEDRASMGRVDRAQGEGAGEDVRARGVGPLVVSTRPPRAAVSTCEAVTASCTLM
jgi:hypothetical protein